MVKTETAVLIFAAVFPAFFLMRRIYKRDRLEKEPTKLLVRLAVFGALAVIPASIAELLLSAFAQNIFAEDSFSYAVLENFVIVAFMEELFKYRALKRVTWKNPEFNCRFDGVVYAVFASLGFALLENIGYVLEYGFGVAVARALLSVPGHASFGVFMGIYYGAAKSFDITACDYESRHFCHRCVLVPTILHGIYDFIASTDYLGGWAFLIFVGAMFLIAFRCTKALSNEDFYLYDSDSENFQI